MKHYYRDGFFAAGSSLFIWIVTYLYYIRIPLFTFQNALFLSLGLTVLLSCLTIPQKTRIDYMVIWLIALKTFGPLISTLLIEWEYFYYYTYHSIDLVFNILLIYLLLTILVKIQSRFERYVPYIIGALVLLKVFSQVIIAFSPIEFLVHVNEKGERGFDFFNLEYYGNLSIQATVGFLSVFLITYFLFVKGCPANLSTRSLIHFNGAFIILFNKNIIMLGSADNYWALWFYSLLEVFAGTALLLWYIASKIENGDTLDKEKQIVWGIQLVLLFPLFYFMFSYPGKRVFFSTLALFTLVELIFVLFYTVLQQRYTIRRLGFAFQDMAEKLGVLWQRDTEGIMITERDGTILTASELISRLRGKSVIGGKLNELLSQSRQETSFSEHNREPGTKETVLKAIDGDSHPVLLTTQALQDVHHQLCLSVVSDINQRQKFLQNQQNQQKKTLELKKLQSLFHLSANIAHNINNYLSGIYGYSQLIAINLKDNPELAEKNLEHLNSHIEKAARYVANLTDTLALKPNDKEAISSHEVIKEAISRLKNTLPDEFGKYYFQLDFDEELQSIAGNTEHFVDLIYQLLHNAIESQPEGGTITIKIKNETLSASEAEKFGLYAGEHIRISIIDEGKGIIPGMEEFIFDPFYSSKDTVGTGLGLTISHLLVNLYGGAIGFEQNTPRGTHFFIIFPASLSISTSQFNQKIKSHFAEN